MANSSPLHTIFFGGFAFFVFLVFASFSQDFGVARLGFVLLSIAGLILLWMPVPMGLAVLFFYIGFEGFLKIISNYHPVVHIGSDLLVGLLVVKVLWTHFIKGESLPAKLPPLWGLFLLHYVWVLICVLNPYSLSLFSSLAGAKVYTSMVLLYFFGYYYGDSEKRVHLYLGTFLSVVLIHAVVGLYQGWVGPESVLSLHPRYAYQLAKYADYAFRPFGLTNLPGAPAVFISLIFPALVYFIYRGKRLWNQVALISFTPMLILLLFLCQVRSSIIKSSLGVGLFVFGAFWLLRERGVKSVRQLGVLVSLFVLSLFVLPYLMQMSVTASESNEEAFDRSFSSFQASTFVTARRDVWKRFKEYVVKVPFGAGFSRVGAAAGKFQKLREQDRLFRSDEFFADNFWLAALIEIGLPGMIIMTLLLLALFFVGTKRLWWSEGLPNRELALCLWSTLVAILVGLWGAESILYNPDAAFFWFFTGVLLRRTEKDLPLEEATYSASSSV